MEFNNKQIEELATNAVKECLLQTDTLSQFIKENDKTPTWDGDVIIYKNNDWTKTNIIGQIKVQVKGKLTDNIKVKECSFNTEMVDLINYKNNGGTIYFLVLINKKNKEQKKVFYETLTPLKINSYIKGHETQGTKTIELKELPKNKNEVQTIFLNFYEDSQKQYSFCNIPPIRIEDLSKRKDIIRISSKTVTFCSKGKEPSPIDTLFNNEIYWYADIEGSSVPHPIEWYPNELTSISQKGVRSVYVNGEQYKDYMSIIYSKEFTKFQFGESTSFVFWKKKKGAKIQYQSSNSMNNRIRDLTFLLSIIELNEIVLEDDNRIKLGKIVADIEFDIDRIKAELAFFRDLDSFFNSLGITADFDIAGIKQNSSFEELNIIMKSIDGKKRIHVDIDQFHSYHIYRKEISNLDILFLLQEVDKEKSLYNIYNYFAYKGILKEVIDGQENVISPYSILSEDDYIKLSNINFSKILDSFKNIVSYSDNIYEQTNDALLKLLLAYDKIQLNEILLAAKDIASWLFYEAGEALGLEIKTLNYLQTIKRERRLNEEENALLFNIADSTTEKTMFKLAANLLLENYKGTKILFERMSSEEKELFKTFPIYSFWK